MTVYRLLIAILLLILGGLQWHLWAGDGSLTHVRALEETIAEQKLENEMKQARNAELVAEINDLKDGLDAVESIARNELGLIKQGETFVLVADDVAED